MAPQEPEESPQRVPPGDRDKAEGDRDTVSPDVEAASRVQESREANRQNVRQPSARDEREPSAGGTKGTP